MVTGNQRISIVPRARLRGHRVYFCVVCSSRWTWCFNLDSNSMTCHELFIIPQETMVAKHRNMFLAPLHAYTHIHVSYSQTSSKREKMVISSPNNFPSWRGTRTSSDAIKTSNEVSLTQHPVQGQISPPLRWCHTCCCSWSCHPGSKCHTEPVRTLKPAYPRCSVFSSR